MSERLVGVKFDACEKCELYKKCENPYIPGRVIYGNKDNIRIILVGEAPGQVEQKLGLPFVGRSGKLLEDVLKQVFPEDIGVYVTNAVRCMPTDGKGKIRKPTDEEIVYCKENLINELSRFDPNKVLVVTLGNTPLFSLKRIKNITKYIGRVFDVKINEEKYKLVPNFHPAYVLRFPHELQKFVSVFSIIRQYIEGNYGENSINYEILSPNRALQVLDEEFINNSETDCFYADIESSSVLVKYDPDGLVIGIALTHDKTDTNYYVPFYLYEFDDFRVTPEDVVRLKEKLGELFSEKSVIGHNIKYDIVQLLYDKYISSFDIKADTRIMAHVIYNRKFDSFTLKDLARTFFSVFEDWEREIKEILKSNPKNKRSYKYIPTGILGKYACLDIYYTKKLYNRMLEDLKPENRLILNLYKIIETEVIYWEYNGIPIDFDFLGYASRKISEEISNIQSRIHSLPEVQKFLSDNNLSKVNINSPKMKDLMFEYLKFPVLRRTESGNPSVTKDEIDEYMSMSNLTESQRVFIDSLVKMRSLLKYRDSYLEIIPKYKDDISNRCRFSFHLCGTVTGRISSPIHSLPSRGDKAELKRLIVAPSGDRVIVSLDYSQLEPRIMASLSGEEALIDAYRRDLDIYKFIGSKIYKVKPEEIDKSTRQRMKAILLGMIYGKTAHSLSQDLEISESEAQELIDEFFRSFPKVKKWIDNQHKLVEKEGGIWTPLGRFIPIPEIYSNDEGTRQEAYRKSQNFPVQSGASELALYNFAVFSRILREKYGSNVLLSVHDSLIIDVNPREILSVLDGIRLYLEELPMRKFSEFLRAPLKCDISIGVSWRGSMSLENREGNMIVLSGYEEDFRRLKGVLRFRSIELLDRWEEPNDSPIFPYDSCGYVRVRVTL